MKIRIINIFNRAYNALDNFALIVRLLFLKTKTVYLFGCPIHPNLGDQAQTLCIKKWIRENYPEFQVISFNWRSSKRVALKLLRKKIGTNDLIFFHSGYLMVDHHQELPVFCEVIKMFPDYRIVVFPQTINFFNSELAGKVSRIFNNHPELLLMCRDEVSYETARELFSKCELLLYPDVVTSLIGAETFTNKRNGILFCMRNDIEAFFKPAEIEVLRERLSNTIASDLVDTSVQITRYSMEQKRSEIISSFLNRLSRYRLIITDRYHGTIFALIAGTPVIVLSSADHKLSSGVKWFSEEFAGYIAYAGDLSEAYDLAQQMLASRSDHPLPPYFKARYFDVLGERLKRSSARTSA